MGAVVNSDPDLWGAVVADVPFVDVLNTMLDESLPLTPGEWPEWGNPVEDPKAFELIRSYSPYDNVKPQAYPPMFISGGLNDPRVTYWEPAKWAAKLRATRTDDNVLVLKTNMGAGHGGKSGRWESLKEAADEMAFVLWQLGVEE
jgi:oligopeptidase B